MDAIVPPGNTSLVTSDHHGYGNRKDCSDFLSLSDRISTAAENVMNNDNSNSHDAGARAERVGFAGIDHTNQNGAEGRLVTNQNGLDTRGNVDRNGSESRGAIERNGLESRLLIREEGHEGRDATRKEGHETREDVERFGFHLASKLDLYGLKSVDGFKDILLQNCHNTDKIIANDNNNFRYVSDKLCSLELNQAKDTAAIQLEAAKNYAAVQLEASKNKCSIELDAAKHAASLAAQLAECCCEQKELTREKADETQRLMLKLDEQNLRDKLRKSEEEVIALRLRASLLPPLTPAVTV